MIRLVTFVVIVPALAACATAGGHSPPSPNGLAHALLAPAALPAQSAQLMLYGQFVGEWDVAVTNHGDDGRTTRGTGEWIFGWVLEGRAIQDTWIVPSRKDRDPAAESPGPYGTTLRFYVPAENRWRIVWINPVGGAIERMTARAIGGEIVQEGHDDEGRPFRWVFFGITGDAFRWQSEELTAAGVWRVNQEMTVTRRPAPQPM